MSETASATISFIQLDPTTFEYDITLNNTGATTIGTFWFAWDDLPDQNFLSTLPAAPPVSPTGWQAFVTHGGPTDGYGIQWTATSASSDLMAGNSLTGFSFTSTDTSSAVFGNSAIDPTFKTTSSFVYQGLPLLDPGFNFVVTPACFRAGTHILTTRGEVAVEDMRIGDVVVTARGASRRVIWIGHRHLAVSRHKTPESVAPVCIARDAFGPARPTHDLYLSPDHAVFADGNLIPVRCLMNRTTIAQVPTDEVTYYHVELDRHDVLLAEGLPVESYLDAGDRGVFANGGDAIILYPDFAARVWEAKACAPLIVAGPALTRLQHMLDARAKSVAQRCEAARGELAINSVAGTKRQA